MDLNEYWLFVLLVGLAKWIRDMFKLLSRYAIRRNIPAEAVQQMAELEERPTEGIGIVLLPQDSIDVASLVPSVEDLEQMDAGHTASTDVTMDLGERAEYVLFVGTAEWTRDENEQEEDDDMYVEVSIDGTSQVHRTMLAKTAHQCWDQNLKITGRLKSIVSIEIKSGAKSLSVARVETSLEHLLEMCTDDDPAALELTIVPLVSATIDQATMAGGLKFSRHFTTGSIGLITVKLSRPPHTPPSLPQLPGIYTDPPQQMGELEGRITAVEIVPPPQESKPNSPVACLQQSKQLGTENHVSANAVTADSDQCSNFLLSVGAAEWTRDPGAREDIYDLFVEVKVKGANEVLRTMHTKTAHWDEYLKITGCLSSIVMIEIRSVAHKSSESLSVVRVETTLGNLLEICTDGDVAALELAIAPLVSGMGDRAAGTGGYMGSKHSAADSIGLLTVKLCRLSHEPLNILQLRYTPTVSKPHTSQLERRIPEEVEEREEMDSDISAIADNITSIGDSDFARFEHLGDLGDLENSIANWQQAIALTLDGHPDKAGRLSNLGGGYGMRFERLGDLTDLENSIASQQQAVALTPDGHPQKAAILSNLGVSYGTRFKRLGDLTDLENSIASQQQAVALTPDGHPDKAVRLTNVGGGYGTRFEQLGDLGDLENSIASLEQAVALTPDGHPEQAFILSNLGVGYNTRFDRLGDLADLENSVASLQQAVALTPDGHPDKAGRLSSLGTGYVTRFDRLGDLADLENSVASLQQAVTLTPDGHPQTAARLINLSSGFVARFERLGDLADLENSVASRQQAVALTPDGHPDKAGRLTTVATGYLTRFEHLADLADLENSVACLQQAVALTPDGHPDKATILSNLGVSYVTRFNRLGDLADLENSVASLQQAVALTPDGHPQKAGRLTNVGKGYGTRFGRFGDLADLENSVASWQQAAALTPDGHPQKAVILSNLGAGYDWRFERLGDLADLENSMASKQQAVALTPDGHSQKAAYFTNLGAGYSTRFKWLGDLADLKNSVASLRQAVALTPDGHPQKAGRLRSLGVAYSTAWIRTHEESHLHNALLSLKLAAKSPGGSPSVMLGASRDWARLALGSGDMPSALQALRTAIEMLPEVAWLGLDIASRQDWLVKEKPEELGCMAATCAIRLGRFEEAVELLDMARSVFWQQASSVRSGLHDLKAERPELAGELETVSRKLDTSSFSGLSTSSDTQLYERWLADHRGLVLKRESLIKEIRSLPGFEFFLKPTPFDRLRDAAAAGRVVIINISQLGTDALIFDHTNPIRHVPLSKVDMAKSLKHTDDIELQQTRGGDAQDQERSLTLPEVLDRIDADTLVPGQETDLATSDGPVHREDRADVTEDRQRSLTRRLPRVWEHILKPIFAESGLGIPLQRTTNQVPTNRILWYLTGPLTFTPIHAAGPVSKVVVSSYVTTLNSLAEAQKRQSEAINGPPMLLAISQPNTPGKSPIPHATNEINMVMQTVSAAGWPEGKLHHFDRALATVEEVSAALDTCSWAHFACHAMQDTRDGMESAFALHDGKLKLSLIAAKRLASARFAFLSTCESASGLQDSPGEAIHLSAGMQFAGFSSVIATMWSIRDEDAPIVAKHTYAYLLRNGVDNIDLTEGAAALNQAVSQLREDPNVTMERWAPFVYYGV